MTYRLPTNATENITGLYTLFKYVNNDASSGYFILGIMAALFIIIFISLKNYKSSVAFVTAAFINVVFSIIFRVLGFISNKWMYLCIVLVAVGIVWVHIDKEGI